MPRAKIPEIVSGCVSAGVFVLLVWRESRRPLRRRIEPAFEHHARNLAIAGLGAVVVARAENPVAQSLSRLVERRKWGLLYLVRMPSWLRVTLAVLLLDYTLYFWHALTHKVPFLWRFHRVHHADLDLDTTTAIRFHFGELALSVPWRAAQIVAIGVSPAAFSIWQTGLVLSILFHHSNVALPIRIERLLNYLFVTPRMHGIHHSILEAETNSNWSSGLSIWDRLHGTLELDVPQESITIGAAGCADPALTSMLALPFAP